MEIGTIPQIENQVRTIKLVDGEFSPSQALEVISSLINQKINYHKLEGLQKWERDHQFDHEPLRNRIEELEEEMKLVDDFISKLKEEGKNLKIDGIIKLKITD